MKVFSLLSRTGNLVNFILDGEQLHSFTLYRCVALQRSVDTGVATSMILSLRALRIFKSFRLLKFIPNINGLLKGIGLALRASFIVSIAFAVLLLIISILYSSLFGGISPELFGDPGVSLFTIFKLFTGDGWSEIPMEIAENSSVFFVGGILGLSLVNSIFVDAMASDNNDEVLKKLDELENKIEELSSKNLHR